MRGQRASLPTSIGPARRGESESGRRGRAGAGEGLGRRRAWAGFRVRVWQRGDAAEGEGGEEEGGSQIGRAHV